MVIYLLFLCALLVLYWYVAKEFYNIAAAKGFPEKKYFWWCFWIPLCGYPMVIALPDRNSAQAAVSAPAAPAALKAPAEPMAPMAPMTPAAPPVLDAGALEEMRRYKELLDMGIITQEEFAQKKRQLLKL